MAQSKTEAVFFFDACMPNIDTCSANGNCKNNPLIHCRHRFRCNAEIILTNKYIRFMIFSDFQMVLHCFYLIQKTERFREISENGRFFIVTKDQKFLQDAEKVWRERKKSANSPNLIFDQDKGLASWGPLKLFIHTVRCKNYGTNGHHDLACAVEGLNKTIQSI